MGKRKGRRNEIKKNEIFSIINRCKITNRGCYYFLDKKERKMQRASAYFWRLQKYTNVAKLLYKAEFGEKLKRSVTSCGDSCCVNPHHVIPETTRKTKTVDGNSESIPVEN